MANQYSQWRLGPMLVARTAARGSSTSCVGLSGSVCARFLRVERATRQPRRWGRWLDGRFSKGFLINAESPAPSVCLWAWSLEVGRIALGGKQSFKQEPTAGTDAPGLRSGWFGILR